MASPEDLVARIRGGDVLTRSQAWQSAGALGAPAVGPLARLLGEPDGEVARAARRGLENIVRRAGAPGADVMRGAVIRELIAALAAVEGAAARREILWLLSEIGGDEAVLPIAAFLGDATLREDARMALERIPGPASLGALRASLESVPESFRSSVGHSLRARGETVDPICYPNCKLVPKPLPE